MPLAVLPRLTQAERRQAEHMTFHMQLLWDRYVRSFVLMSASGLASDRGGQILASVPPQYQSVESAAHYLISKYPRRTMEPDWYRPADAIDAANRLAIPNLAKFIGAVGSTPWVIDELRYTRNFFAHRSRRSAIDLRSQNWISPNAPLEAENTMFAYDVGVRKFEVWGQFIKTIAGAML